MSPPTLLAALPRLAGIPGSAGSSAGAVWALAADLAALPLLGFSLGSSCISTGQLSHWLWVVLGALSRSRLSWQSAYCGHAETELYLRGCGRLLQRRAPARPLGRFPGGLLCCCWSLFRHSRPLLILHLLLLLLL